MNQSPNNRFESVMIPAAVRSEKLSRIQKGESKHGVRVLLAVESGSRACSNHQTAITTRASSMKTGLDWYLSVNLEERRDVIEYPIVDEIDVNGWDVRKALRLFARSNPAFVEGNRPRK